MEYIEVPLRVRFHHELPGHLVDRFYPATPISDVGNWGRHILRIQGLRSVPSVMVVGLCDGSNSGKAISGMVNTKHENTELGRPILYLENRIQR
jgi:hypothetical protein